MALPDDILKTIADLERRVKNMERNPQPANIAMTDFKTYSFTMAAQSHHNQPVIMAVPSGARVLAIPEIGVYRDSVSFDNLFPHGPAWVYEEALEFHTHWWFNHQQSDGNNLRLQVWLSNHNPVPFDIVLKVRFRYLQQGAALT